MKPLFFLSVFFWSVVSAVSQPSERIISRKEYIDFYKDEAIKEMLLDGIPASITLAQGILESDNGNSPLAKYANNHFGIKCHSGWDGPTFYQNDDTQNECFRKYYSVYNSFKDHSEFLKTRQRYAFLFELKSSDYKGWARGLKKAGYATNPKYAELLIKLIEDNNLQQYDRERKMPVLEKENNKPKIEKIKPVPEKPAYQVKVNDNNIKYVLAKQGDSYFKIAEENSIGLWQVLKYNDREKENRPEAGEVVYLQPKRNKAKKQDIHVIKKGETWWTVSQLYGIKMSQLLKKNGKTASYELQPGDQLFLRKNKP